MNVDFHHLTRMSIGKYILFLLIHIVIISNAQQLNLSLNGSFEEFYFLPQNFTEVKQKNTEFIPKWYFLSTPDYFNKLNKCKVVGIPRNFAGSVTPQNCRACVGLILRSDPVNYTLSPKYSEHIQNELSDTLHKGQLYCVRMYVSLAENSGFASDALGIYFSRNRISFRQKDDVLLYNPQIDNIPGNLLLVKDEWMIYSGIYKANGGERFMTIGNFKKIEDTRMMRLRSKLRQRMHFFSYYYIDNVQVRHITDTSECLCSTISKTLDTSFVNRTYISEDSLNFVAKNHYFGDIIYDKYFVLNNVYFDFDKYSLLPQSFCELDSLYSILSGIKNFKVIIQGHTDSMGTAQYNTVLSENRARAVASYLVQKGINPDYVTFIGYGASKPVAGNSTPDGRQLNRRVEFVIRRFYNDENE